MKLTESQHVIHLTGVSIDSTEHVSDQRLRQMCFCECLCLSSFIRTQWMLEERLVVFYTDSQALIESVLHEITEVQ